MKNKYSHIECQCENINMKQYELTKEQWERIKELLPPERIGKRGRPRKDNRNISKFVQTSDTKRIERNIGKRV